MFYLKVVVLSPTWTFLPKADIPVSNLVLSQHCWFLTKSGFAPVKIKTLLPHIGICLSKAGFSAQNWFSILSGKSTAVVGSQAQLDL